MNQPTLKTSRYLLMVFAITICHFTFATGTMTNKLSNQKDKITISNSVLTLNYDAGNSCFEIVANANNRRIVENLHPNIESYKITKESINDAVFGKGNSIRLISGDGNSVTLALYPGQPFLFISQTIENKGKDTLDIPRLNPASFLVDLQKPAKELKTLGTAGLLEADKNPGSYVFLSTVDPSTRNGIVAGWLTNEKGSGVLFSSIHNGKVKIESQVDYGHYRISAGKTASSETLLIGYFDDARIGQELFADAIAKKSNIRIKPRNAVYCTWYSEKNGGAGSEESCIELAQFIKKNLQPYGMGTIQIDDLWQDGGKFNGPTRGFDRARKATIEGAAIYGSNTIGFPVGYPNGMAPTAQALKKAGLNAGIWWMPFARNHQDPEYKDRQHWFARHINGKPFETAWGGTSLDLTHPEVQKHVAYISKTMKDWGYDYFKMDGLWTGTVTKQVYINDGYKNDSIGNCKPLYDPCKTQIEAFRTGLKIIRKTTNNEVFLSGCCISQNMRSFGASIGLVDAMRIGPDFNHDGESIRTGAIRASRLYFLNGRVWWNDPDPSMLREKGASFADPAAQGIGGLTRARLLPSFVAISGQFFLSSDWLPDLPEERLEIMKRCMASHTGIARPIDAFDKFLPEIWLASDKKTGTSRNVIGLFNWKTTSQNIGCSLDWAGLDKDQVYYAFDFWNNKPLADLKDSFAFDLEGESTRIIALRAKTNHPVVVSTSQHITQGMIDLLKEEWSNKNLSGTSKIIGGDDYELRIAGLDAGKGYSLTAAKLADNKNNASIEVLPSSEKGWLRVKIKCEKNCEVNWQLNFE